MSKYRCLCGYVLHLSTGNEDYDLMLVRNSNVESTAASIEKSAIDSNVFFEKIDENSRNVYWCPECKRLYVSTPAFTRSEEHTSELQSPCNLVCRLLLEKKRLDLAGGDVKIVDRNSNPIEVRNAQGVRVIPKELTDISPNLQNATIAVEDKHFYQHHGVDWGRVIKAGVIDVITRKPQQGASTITEQLAKIAILRSPQKTILRKLREALLATALESKYSKTDILKLYLNSIYYGHNATGVEAAAEVYFGKHAKDLTLGEASLLAGLPNGPSYYDPALHKDRALARQAVVLDAMVTTSMVTSAPGQQAKNETLTFVFKENRSTLAPHFVDYVFEQLETVYGPSIINTGGLTVKTTLDLNLQKAAEQAVAVGQQRLGRLGADNGDFVAIDPKTGQILAMVGSADYLNNDIKGQFNVVTALRQPGSSFKPYARSEERRV